MDGRIYVFTIIIIMNLNERRHKSDYFKHKEAI